MEKLEKPNKALQKEIDEGIHLFDKEPYVKLDYHNKKIKKVFDDFIKEHKKHNFTIGTIAMDKLKKRHLPTFQKEKRHNSRKTQSAKPLTFKYTSDKKLRKSNKKVMDVINRAD